MRQYFVKVCTSCWNNDFDIDCANCRPKSLSDQRWSFQFAPILKCTFNNLVNHDEQIEHIKNNYVIGH